MTKKYRILVTDGVSPRGVELLKSISKFEVEETGSLKEDELLAKIGEIDAIIVRSQTKVSGTVIKASRRLKIIGRAGVGIDNVDVDTATEKGVIVMTTPGGSTISTAEHTFSLLLSVARMIPQAHMSMKAGKWDRKKFQGTEINGKTLGILGMGRIGSEVAKRAVAFGMRVVVYDPYLAPSRVQNSPIELFNKLEEMLPLCDFITVHMPMTKETRAILNAKSLALCKSTVRIINCARGGLVDEAALEEALKKGKVAGAAFDVYEKEPPAEDFALRKLDQFIMTPHLGASTQEAQESVGIEIAESIRDGLVNGTIRNAINVPNVDAKTLAKLRPYLDLGSKLGKMLAQILPSRCEQLTVNYYGKLCEQDTTPITRAVLKGFLLQAGGTDVNEVNAPKYAENLGLKFSEIKKSDPQNHSELLNVEARLDGQTFEVSGTFFGSCPRVVSINGYSLDVCPEGALLIMLNKDQPGIVGRVGTLMGQHNVNIGNMSLSRSTERANALCVLNLDSMPPVSTVEKIKSDSAIYSVQTVQL